MARASQSSPNIGMIAEPSRHELRLASLLVVLATMTGGGGSPNPLPEIILQLSTAILAAAWIWVAAKSQTAIDRRVKLAALLILVLPAIQLVPLPPAMWQSLPGRDLQLAALRLVDAQDSWRPISISPQLSLASLLSLGAPVLAMILASQLSSRERSLVVALVCLLALVSFGLGVLQVISGGNWGHFYQETHRGVITGFHANRNAAADLLLLGVLAAPFLATLGQNETSAIRHGFFVAVLSFGVLLTQSRMGIAILPLAILGSIALRYALAGWAMSIKRFAAWIGMIALTVGATIAGVLLTGPSRLSAAMERFSATNDLRFELWQDGWFAAAKFWPVGSGIGTIQPVLVSVERLENVDRSLPNRVHNDFLEYLVEGGFLAAATLLSVAIIGVKLLITAMNGPTRRRPIALFATFTVVGLAMHSIMDYPLRAMSLATLAGLAFGFLVPKSGQISPVDEQRGEQI